MHYLTSLLRIAGSESGEKFFRPTIRLWNAHKLNAISCRGAKLKMSVTWVRPEKITSYHPSVSGDLESLPQLDPSGPKLLFDESKELKTANDIVKKIFSLELQCYDEWLRAYKKNLADRVRRHPYDDDSFEVHIAQLTAKVRFLQRHMEENPNDRERKTHLLEAIGRRRKCLRILRKQDYRKFEWILEKLNIVYKPLPNPTEKASRRPAMRLLAEFQSKVIQEERLAEYKKQLDQEKVPFLEKKLEKLKWIKEQEEIHNLQPTVLNKDIEDCVEQLQRVRIELEKSKDKNYARKIHPKLLVPYD